ncbi:MAG TPA: phospholipase D-like domain-containing protein [Kiloniellales bacterium]
MIDEAIAFVTSANFTMAAQARNLEAGVLVRSPSFALALIAQFESLVTAGGLRRLPGL